MASLLPKISIGLPVFNGELYLSDSIASILHQTFTDFELVISDNASTDGTRDICLAYREKDRRVKYFCNDKNLGGAYNDNRVFQLSSGEYFKWASHDDLWAPELLAKCAAVLAQDPHVVLAYPKTILIDQRGQVTQYYEDDFHLMAQEPHQRYRRVIGKKTLLNPFYGLVRSSALRRTQLVRNYEASDRVLLGELSLQGQFFEVPEFLFYRRIHPKKSTVVNTTLEDKAIWFDPALRGKILAPKIRRFLGFFTAIHRAPLSWRDKMPCYAEFVCFYFSPKTITGRLSGFMEDMKQAFKALASS